MEEQTKKTENPAPPLTGVYTRHFKIKLFISFILGAAVAILIILSIFPVGNDKLDLSEKDLLGTMYNANSASSSSQSLKINIKQVNSDINISNLSQGYIQVLAEISSPEVVNMKFIFNNNNFKVYGLRPIIQNNESSISSNFGSVIISNRGENKFVFLLKSENRLQDKIDIKIFSNEFLIYENSITVKN